MKWTEESPKEIKNRPIEGDWWDDPYSGQEWGWKDQLLRVQGENFTHIIIVIVIINSDSSIPRFPYFNHGQWLGDVGSSASAYSRPSDFEALDQHLGRPDPLPKTDGHQILIYLVKVPITEK